MSFFLEKGRNRNEFYEIEEAIVYHTILDIDDPVVTKALENSDNKETQDKSAYIGAVVCRPLVSYATTTESNLPLAFPVSSNIREYPLNNEIILVAKYFGKLFYYKLNNLNSINSNDSSTLRESFKPNPTGRGTAGSPSRNSNTDSLGEYFKRNDKIHKLKSFEGDIIFEGRFGNSIRLAGYNPNSYRGEYPSLLIRNGENLDSQNNLQLGELTEEDITDDGSSIHMTSGDILSSYTRPTKVAIRAFKDYPNQLKGNQIIVNSTRLIFSANEQLICHAEKSLGFITDSVFSIDSKDTIQISSVEGNFHVSAADVIFDIGDKGRIFLGKNGDKSQKIVRGNDLVKWLGKLCDELAKETHPTGVGPSGVPVNASKYSQLKRQLNEMLSEKNFTV